MVDLTLFKVPLLKDLEEEVVSRLVSVYIEVVSKKVQDLLRNSTPFKMVASVILCIYFLFSITSPLFFVADNYYFR